LGGDAYTVVAVNLTRANGRPLRRILEGAAEGLRAARIDPSGVAVSGTPRAERLDGWTRGDSPAEPQRITLVAAEAGPDTVLLLTLRGFPRADVDSAFERIVGSLEVKQAEEPRRG
jgi:hypothetical protein